MFKKALELAAAHVSMRIPGKGQATYTKHFLRGVLVVDPIVLPVTQETIDGEWLFLPADGKSGSGKRVMRCYPVVPEWSGKVKYLVLDHTITEKVFRSVLECSGQFIGIGRWRAANGGLYGRFDVKRVTWRTM